MNDLISRQAAIDAIHCDITVTGRQNAELVAATIGAFADRIKALPSAQPEQRWIPCKLKNQYYIPELNGCKDKPYLVTYETATGKRYVTKTNIHNGRVQRKENRIIAWMPLPEPYKGADT